MYKMWGFCDRALASNMNNGLAHKLFTSSFLEVLKDLKVAVCLY